MKLLFFRSLLGAALLCGTGITTTSADDYDIVVYGGTSGGLAAGLQAKRMGKSVVVIEPTARMGGLTTGGLGQTDIGNKAAIGGISREFYRNIRNYYQDAAHWRFQTPEEYESGGQSRTNPDEDTMWTFEPSAALAVYEQMAAAAELTVVLNERLNRETGVEKEGARIVSITMESGRKFAGKIFLDATYEGDLMAAAGVEYMLGREPNTAYNETLNGVQTAQAKKHQFEPGIDPHVVKGDPASGLLPFLDPDGPGTEGEGDKRIQAYCFRMCLTDHDPNRLPFEKPEGYREDWYELLFRNYEAGAKYIPWNHGLMPNHKSDTNNHGGQSTDFIGQNYEYPEASYARRAEIAAQHRLYQKGLMWTLANHPRVPEDVRGTLSKWGMCKDEFTEGNGWQEQLYVREARRLAGTTVMTQHHCQGRMVVPDPVGLGAYGMDSHNVQRYVDAEGHARNEGDVQVGGFPPYAVGYGALTPKPGQCVNLLVPVCLSATHIAFGSIRMEPVFMVLGQSAATAASMAIDAGIPVQQVPYPALRERLLADDQVLEWKGKGGGHGGGLGIDPKTLPGIVMDDEDAVRAGFATQSTSSGKFLGKGYRHDGNADKGSQATVFLPFITEAGLYEIRLAYTPNANRATNAVINVGHVGGITPIRLNQTRKPPIDDLWISLGKYICNPGQGKTWVEIKNDGTDGYVIIDGVQFLPAQP